MGATGAAGVTGPAGGNAWHVASFGMAVNLWECSSGFTFLSVMMCKYNASNHHEESAKTWK